jgi:hypothetical protein
LLTPVCAHHRYGAEERSHTLGGRRERDTNLSTRPRALFRLCALAMLSVGLLFAPGAAQAAATGTVVAWGCSVSNFGQCSVAAGLSGVTAIAAGFSHSLALKGDGTVVAWGCGADTNFGQCSVPAGLSGVTAIAAGAAHSLALKSDGTVVAWGCQGTDSGACSVPAGLSRVTALSAGTAHSLALFVPIARALCTVPNVVGKKISSAKLTISRKHCRTGKVGHAYSPKRKRGIVLSQRRRPGRVLPALSKIDLVVSRGRHAPRR